MSRETMLTYLVTDALTFFSIYLLLTLALNMQHRLLILALVHNDHWWIR